MKIINPKVELWEQGEELDKHILRCARICYRRDSGNDKVLYNNLIQNHHWSMFRHATSYYIIPKGYEPKWVADIFNCIKFYHALIVGIDIKADNNYFYVVTNHNWNLDHTTFADSIEPYHVDNKEFANANEIAWNMMRYTFKVTTQISISRELNRVSPNNISEQSTRYVYEDGTICKPHWMTNEEVNLYNNGKTFDLKESTITYLRSCAHSFKNYKELVDNNMRRQDARGVLPLDTATRCVYTYSIDEWRNIINLRYYGTTGKPHPNAKIIAGMIKEELNKLSYNV